MKLNTDLHIHSTHSCDARATIDEMCHAAIDKGFSRVCFTEHFDMNPKDDGYGYYHHEKYTKDIRRAQDKFAAQLKILQGIEFGEPHLYPKEFETLLENGFDFVLGSIHWLGEHWVGDKSFQAGFSLEQIFELHYTQVLQAVQFGGFDAIAHIDFPKRYLLDKHEPRDLIESIVGELVKRNIALEINTSPLRKGYTEIYPSHTILQAYVKHGGAQVTIGSDAHRPGEIGQDFTQAIELVEQYKLRPVIFEARRRRELEAS